MKKYTNIWEDDYGYEYTNSIDEFFQFIDLNGGEVNFILKKLYDSDTNADNFIEYSAKISDTNLIFNDNSHNIVFARNNIYSPIFINPDFFVEHKDEFVKETKKRFFELLEKRSVISVPDYIIDDEVINAILNVDTSKKNVYF